MILYELLNVPNQQFGTTVNGHDFLFKMRTFRGVLYVDISIDGELKMAGVKATPNVGLLVGDPIRLAAGNFGFVCQYGDYPSYDLFGTAACQFVYQAEE